MGKSSNCFFNCCDVFDPYFELSADLTKLTGSGFRENVRNVSNQCRFMSI